MKRPDGRPVTRWPDGCYAYWGYHLSPDIRDVEAAMREIDRMMERRLSRWA